MRVIYIAGPMSGIEDFNYPAFNAAAVALSEAGWKVLNPVDCEAENISDGYQNQPWTWYLRIALRMVTRADAIALLPGWEKSKGANLEWLVADELGLDIRNLAAWLP